MRTQTEFTSELLEQSFKQLPPIIPWKQLDATEQSVVKYGLNLSIEMWDELVSEIDVPPARTHSVEQPEKISFTQWVSSMMSTSLKWVGPISGLFLSNSAARRNPTLRKLLMQVPTLVDAFADPIKLSSSTVETVLFLDDSKSMRGKNLQVGKELLRQLEPILSTRSNAENVSSALRVVKFGTDKTVLQLRDNKFNNLNAVLLGWDGSSETTYLWKMLEQDILKRYRPSQNPKQGKIRIIILTDGYDTQSPGSYRGVNGMNPMMEKLISCGFNIEFHIALIRCEVNQQKKEVNRYQALAEATGGGYVAVNASNFNDFNACIKFNSALDNFLKHLSSKGSIASIARQQQKVRYLFSCAQGRYQPFGWMK
jgi:hypothetical protein